MKKSRYQIKFLDMLIVSAICVIGIVFGSIFDWKLANLVYNPNSGLGAFFETFGESIAYAMIPLGGVFVFKALFPQKKVKWKILGISVLILANISCIYFLGDSFTYAHNDYGRRLNTFPSYLVATILSLLFTLLFSWVIRKDASSSYLLQAGVIILLARFAQFILMHGLKVLAARPRYRFLVNTDLNTNGEIFHAWWEFDFRGLSISDNYKSWPSGHCATASQLFLLPLLYPVRKGTRKNGRTRLFVFSFAVALLIAYSRRVYGAHFLSDVSFGLLVGSLCAYLSTAMMYVLVGKKKRRQEEQ